MRRLFSIAAFALFLGLLPANAQRYGSGGRAMASAGRAGGFAVRGSSGHSFGGHPFASRGGGFAANPGRSAFGHSFRSSFHQPGFHQPRFDRGFRDGQRGFRDGRRGFRDHDRRFRRGFRDCFGCGGWGGYPWWYAGYYDPYWWWDSSSSYDEDYDQQLALAEEMDQRSLEQQRFLDQQDQDIYAHSSGSSSRNSDASQSQKAESVPATVLVFRDQRRQEVQNYAIVGETLWNFSPQRTQKIPLADLDLPATAKANEDRGVDFRVPAAGEGQ